MELSNRQVITLFPSYLFVGKLPDLTLCDRLEAGLRAMKAANSTGDGKAPTDAGRYE